MKRTFKHLLALSLLLCSVFIFSSCGEKKQPYLMPENVDFGMSQSKVISKNKSYIETSNDDFIICKLPTDKFYTVKGCNTKEYKISYFFNNDKLYSVSYDIMGLFGDFIYSNETYENIIQHLKTNYGEPTEVIYTWINDVEENYTDISQAIKDKNIIINNYWELENFKINFDFSYALADISYTDYSIAFATEQTSTNLDSFNIDFDKCADDTIKANTDPNFFDYVKDVYISTDKEDKKITFTVVVGDSTSNDIALEYADTLIRQFNLYASFQDSTLTIGSKDYYGKLYDFYNVQIAVAPLSKVDDPDNWIINQYISAGTHTKIKIK